jgi:hypothetical protein
MILCPNAMTRSDRIENVPGDIVQVRTRILFEHTDGFAHIDRAQGLASAHERIEFLEYQACLADVDFGAFEANGIAPCVKFDTELRRDEAKMTFAIAVENYGRVVVVEGNALLYMFRLVDQTRLPRKGLLAVARPKLGPCLNPGRVTQAIFIRSSRKSTESSTGPVEGISAGYRSGARSTIPFSLFA